MNLPISLLFVFVAGFSWGQSPTHIPGDDPTYFSQGNLVIFRAVPRDKTVKLYLLGKESAELNFQKDAQLVSVTLLEKGNRRNLEFKSSDGYYEILGAPSKGKYDLELRAQVRSQPEKATLSIGKP